MAMLALALPLPGGGGMLMAVYVGDVATAIGGWLGLTRTRKKWKGKL